MLLPIDVNTSYETIEGDVLGLHIQVHNTPINNSTNIGWKIILQSITQNIKKLCFFFPSFLRSQFHHFVSTILHKKKKMLHALLWSGEIYMETRSSIKKPHMHNINWIDLIWFDLILQILGFRALYFLVP